MAVYLAYSDETSQGTHLSQFYRTGFVAPRSDWDDWFVPAWQERVLQGPPSIPYLHMTEMRSPRFRAAHRLSGIESERRIDEAFRVATSMGSLVPIGNSMNAGHLRNIFREFRVVTQASKQRSYSDMEPDYLSFIVFVLTVLAYVHKKRPECDKVDFIVEGSGRITSRLQEFHITMPSGLEHIGSPELIPLLGHLISAGKESIPLQAADLLCWYTRRSEAGQLDLIDLKRYKKLATREGFLADLTDEQLTRIGNGLSTAQFR